MSPLLASLKALERELHRPATLTEARRQALLHADFREFGRSGARYGRDAMLTLLRNADGANAVHSRDFELQELAPNLALLTYRSAHLQPDGSLARHSNRMSLWKFELTVWQMMFHQGTATAPFDLKD